MSRNYLLENGYNLKIVEPKKYLIKMFWAISAIIFLAANSFVFFAILSDKLNSFPLPYVEFSVYLINIIFIATPFIYFISKDILAVLCCADKTQDMEMKADETGVPSLKIREALKTRQIVLIYFVPAFAIYIALLAIILISGGNLNFFILIFIMALFMSYDFTLVVFAAVLKIAYKPEYIGINNHVYSFTLYSKKYAADESFGDTLKIKKNKTRLSFPDFGFIRKMTRAQKRVSLLIAAVLVFAGISAYSHIKKAQEEKQPDIGDFETYLAYCDAMKPAIKKYDGDPAAASEIASSGSGRRLVGGNLIYCGDDDSVIYFDKSKNSVMRLSSGGETERLCVYAPCRNDPGQKCGHMPEFAVSGVYANGFLYGIRQYMAADKKGREVLRAYIIRYDTGTNIMDKLIEFERGDEDAYIRKMTLDGGSLYVWVSAGYDAFYKRELTEETEMLDLGVVKIDLESQSACVLYSEGTQRKDYVLNLSRFYNGYIFGAAPKDPVAVPLSSAPVSGVIYKCGTDIDNFVPVADLGWFAGEDGYISICARQFDIYEDSVYYSTSAGNNLYRYNMRLTQSNQPESESLFDNISKFCIDGGYLYYEIAAAKDGNSYKTDVIYRIRIYSEYMDFNFGGAVAVNVPEPGCYTGEWDVHEGSLYIVSYSGSERHLSRVNISSNAAPYILW